VAADVLVMASLAQVAGQYVFLLFGAKHRRERHQRLGAAGRHLWIVAMTYICYRGIEVSANFQKVLLTVELIMLLVLAVVALVKVYSGTTRPGRVHTELRLASTRSVSPSRPSSAGIILMLFIYWGWDTAVSVNEETKDPAKTPGRAAIISTLCCSSPTCS
jgi:amino acid transporter